MHFKVDNDITCSVDFLKCLHVFFFFNFRDNGGLSNIYQEKFLPKLKDKSHTFMKWLIDRDLLSSSVVCPNAKNDRMCLNFMEFVLAIGLYDLYQLRYFIYYLLYYTEASISYQ